MDKLGEELDRVKIILTGNPRGMTISEVSKKIGVNRNSVAKYLEIMRTSGDVEMKIFGRSKIFMLSSRMPLATALSLSSEMIVLIDGNLRILDANDQFLRFTESSRDEIVGYSLEEVNSDILAHPSILLNVKDTLNGKEYTHEISVARARDELYFKIKLLPVTTSETQRRAAIIYENITARKKAENALKESEARYRAVVEDQTDLICRILPDTTITFVNEAWCRYFKCDRENVLGKKQISLMPPGYSPTFRRDLESIRINNPSITVESDIVWPGGQKQWLKSTYTGSFDSRGRLAEVQVVAHDITERRLAEEMLRKLSRAVENSPATVVITDAKGDIEYVNPKFTVLTGYTFYEVRGKNPRFLKSGHTSQDDYRRLWETIKSGKEWHGEFLNKKKNGDYYWESALISPVTDAGGKVTNFIAIKEDITERRRANIALKESEARYRAVVETQADVIVRMLPDTSIMFANEAFFKSYGMTPAELIGRRFIDMIPPANRDQVWAKLDAISVLNESGSNEDLVFMQDGSPHWFQWNCQGIFDDDGAIKEYQVVIRDITHLKLAEIALKESEKQFRAAFDQSPIGACIISLDFRFLRVNPEYCRITGYTEEELLSMTFPELTHPDDLEKDIGLAKSLISGQIEEYHVEKRNIHKDGRVIWLRKHARLVKDESGQPLYFFPLFEDITEKRQMEESLKLTQFSVDKALDEVVWVNPGGRILYVNEASCRRLDYSREELMEMYVWDIDMRATPEIYRETVENLKRTGFTKGESVHRARDGTEYPVDITAVYLPRDGEAYVCAYARDITDRKRLEESLRITQTSVDRAVDEINWVGPDGRVLYVNEASCRRLGYSREELLTMSVWDFNPQFVPEKFPPLMEDLRANGHKKFESVHRTRDGEEYPIDVTLIYLPWGEKEFICAFDRDISGKKAILESLQFTQFAMDNAPDGILWVDSDGNLTYVNDVVCRVLSYTRDELQAMKVSDINPVYDNEKWRQRYADSRTNGTLHYKSEHLAKDGTIIPVEVYVNYLCHNRKEYFCAFIHYPPGRKQAAD